MKTYDNLQELTGLESGAVVYGDEILIMNWASIEGLPTIFADQAYGKQKQFTATEIDPPQHVISAMQDHEEDQGDKINSDGFTAWNINDGEVIVAVQARWN